MTSVLIAVDGSPLDRVLAHRALQLFGPDADYVVVNVSDQHLPLSVVPLAYGAASALSAPEISRLATLDDDAAAAAEHVAEEAAHDAGLDQAVTIGEIGDPVAVVLAAAEEHAAQVIVVGTKDRSWFSRLMDPSVSHAITRLAETPVLVVRDDLTDDRGRAERER